MGLVIDGSHGEGGGQILRTALALAALLGRDVEIINIRKGRRNPGLQAQHLTAVRAVAAITEGRLAGDSLGSEKLFFQPQNLTSGIYEFDVSSVKASAGSVGLVFQAVHLGNVILNLTPTDTSISPVHVQIVVERPKSLGTTDGQVVDSKTGESYNLDEKLVDLGHRRGIPPHFIKGHVEQESNFDLRAYRYEPLSSDLAYMSSCRLRSTNCNLRTQRPYSLYRLATSDGLTQGRDILTDDISPRSRYFILRAKIRRPISNTDTLVSALEIYQQNNSVHNWSQESPARARRVRAEPDLLDFTAQTPLAASYGLLQILYPTAISPMQWRGVNGARNPSLLFDSEANLAAGGGSLPLGSNYVRRLFQRVNSSLLLDPVVSNREMFDQAFSSAFQAYNLYRDGYGAGVLQASQNYQPLPATSIFP